MSDTQQDTQQEQKENAQVDEQLIKEYRNLGQTLMPLIEKTALNDGIPIEQIATVLNCKKIILEKGNDEMVKDALLGLFAVYDISQKTGRTGWTLNERGLFINILTTFQKLSND